MCVWRDATIELNRSSPPIATKREPQQRSRSRSIIPNTTPTKNNNHPNSVAQYSPESHPTTDPSLLALTQQQVYADPKQATPSSIIDDGTKFAPSPAFPIDPALGSASPAPAEYKPFKPSDVEVPSSPPSVDDLSQLQNEPALEEEEEEIVGDDVAMAVEDESTVGNISSRPKKRSSSSAEDNDAELRRLAKENADVELSELARRVRNEENSPSAEKTRQVYGLGWYVHRHYGMCSLD